MPSSSKQQQKFMGMVHALQKGDMKQSDASPEIKKVAKDMNPSDVKDFASTKHSGLPKRVKQEIVKRLKEYAMMIPNHQTQPSAPADSLRSDDEMDVNENFPANWLVGRVSDQHSKLGTTPRKDYDDTNFDKEDSGQEDLENENMNEAPEIKTITKKEWSKIKKFNKHIGQDGTYYVMAYSDKLGTHLNPVKIVKESKLNEDNWKAEKNSIFLNGSKVGDYSYDRDSDAFWMDNIKGSGQKSFDTTKEMLQFIQKHKSDYLKARKSYVGKGYMKETTNPADIIKDLDKVRHDLIKKVDVLIAKKKKLYSNVDIESPMSADEKQLDKDIQSIFSQIQQLIQQKRKIKTESLNDELSGNDLEMVVGIIDILKQVKDKENRKEIALNMIKQFKEEDIDFDYSKFLSHLKEYSSTDENSNLYEVGLGDWHFKAIQKLYQKAGSFGRKKIAAVITKNPNSNWNKIERELQDSDYYEISDYSDKLGLSEVVENLIKKKTK